VIQEGSDILSTGLNLIAVDRRVDKDSPVLTWFYGDDDAITSIISKEYGLYYAPSDGISFWIAIDGDVVNDVDRVVACTNNDGIVFMDGVVRLYVQYREDDKTVDETYVSLGQYGMFSFHGLSLFFNGACSYTPLSINEYNTTDVSKDVGFARKPNRNRENARKITLHNRKRTT